MTRKTVQYLVTFEVEDDGQFDASYLRAGIDGAIGFASQEGWLTPLEDETTLFNSWRVEEAPV